MYIDAQHVDRPTELDCLQHFLHLATFHMADVSIMHGEELSKIVWPFYSTPPDLPGGEAVLQRGDVDQPHLPARST